MAEGGVIDAALAVGAGPGEREVGALVVDEGVCEVEGGDVEAEEDVRVGAGEILDLVILFGVVEGWGAGVACRGSGGLRRGWGRG